MKNSKLNIILADASLIAHGLSGHTTGKINYLQELIYSDILKKYNYETAKLYYESQIDSINKIKEIIKKEKINCDLEKVTSYLYTNKENEIEKIKKEKELLNSFGANIKEENKEIPYINYLYAIKAINTYVFHPVKYLLALKEICLKSNKKIYEKTKITNILKEGEYYICKANNFKIKAKKIIIASHYPSFLFPYFFPIKANIEKSYISASLSKKRDITAINSKKPTISIRYHKNWLIYLTNSSNISNNINEKKNYLDHLNKIKKLNLKAEYIWKNDDIITLDKIPYIGSLKKEDNTFLIGTGYNTWGMTNGTLASLILSDLILGKVNKYTTLCNPLRVINLKNTKDIIINLFSNSKGYLESKINKNKDWYENIEFKNNLAIYKEKNQEYIVYNKCPHMGCSLIFNEIDKTWDCPCHASRFTKEGICIKGPSTKDIKYK